MTNIQSFQPKVKNNFKNSFIPFFPFWFLVTFGDEVTKILQITLHFARQDGQDGKNGTHRKENHTTKVTKKDD